MEAISLMQFLRDYLTATLMWAGLGSLLLVWSVVVWRACQLLLLRPVGGRGAMHSAPSVSPDTDLS
jgi:hypothetical protein